jgi:GTPase SAR1 family protein
MDDYKYLFKVVLIGNASVGKTCLVRRFCQDVFPTGQAATIGVDFLIKTVEVNGEKIKVRTKKSCFSFSFIYVIILASNMGYSWTRTFSFDNSIILSIGQCINYCF